MSAWVEGPSGRLGGWHPLPQELPGPVEAGEEPPLEADAECAVQELVDQDRAASFLASAFDVLFALLRAPHPGEKRILEHLRRLGPRVPPELEAHVSALLESVGRPGLESGQAAAALAATITALCRSEGLPP